MSQRKKIMLGDAVDDIINFRDSRMSDNEFTKKLIDEIVNDDLAIRPGPPVAGTSCSLRRSSAARKNSDCRYAIRKA